MTEQPTTDLYCIAVLGGTGALGSGLARRWAKTGHRVILGSRDPVRARGAVDALNEGLSASQEIRLATYAEAAQAADVAVLTAPFAAQTEILELVKPAMAGKVLVDCTVPLRPPKVGTVQLPALGSAAQTAQATVGADVRVVSAFQNVAAALLRSDKAEIDCDVLVCADDDAARALGVRLVQAAGLRGFEAGPLANSAAADALTSVLVQINRRYKSRHAGLRITGLPQSHHTARPVALSFRGLTSLPSVAAGDDLTSLILEALSREHVGIQEGDVVVVAQKIVSKAASLTLDLQHVDPSPSAIDWARKADKDPRFVEAVLRESREVVAAKKGVLITEHVSGSIMANAGVDRSNVDPGSGEEPVLLLPRDPDKAAEALRAGLAAGLGVDIGLIINDSWGRPWRMGTTGAAMGVAGMAALHDFRGRKDMFGRELVASVEAVADEIAGAANIVMGQAGERVPVVIVTGFNRLSRTGSARDLIRNRSEDMFR